MIELSKQSGLPIQWNSTTKQLVLGETREAISPDVRLRQQMTEVLYDREADDLDELYYMYRGVALPQDVKKIEERGLRYDITVIRPGTLGSEYVKTAGHYHPLKPGTGTTYPEVYEVLHGRAHYLLQRYHPDNPDQLEAVILINAKPGDKVLIPPHFGHITINPGDDFLIMSNWVAEGFSSIYDPIREHGGGAYYELQTEEGPEFVPNKNYNPLPPLERCSVTPVPQLKLITGLPIYRVFQEDNSAFDFLVNPENYQDIFDSYLQELYHGS